MENKLTFTAQAGQTLGRGLLLLALNTGTAEAPVWSLIGRRVEDSSAEYDWQRESKKDILDNTYSTMRDPIITQSFEPWELSGGDAAQEEIWNKAIRDHDAQGLCNMDLLMIHLYAGTSAFAERYPGSAVEVTGLGGAGGGSIGMPITVTFGGKRQVGTASVENGVITFTAA